jgi:putative DNA primase/helicase
LTSADLDGGSSPVNNIDRATEIERLAALETVDYEVVRKDAADQLGIRATVLDSLRNQKRRELKLHTARPDDGQGRAVTIPDVLPWADAIEGDRVATGLAVALKRYVVLSDTAADAVALWVLHTWLFDKFIIAPRLAITSPTKGCGKTTVLRFLNQVVRRPKRAGSISPPALFRAVEQFSPTIILDETEKYIEHGSDLHALLNEGHCRGGTVLRVLGEKQELREFSVFAAVAFAANGKLPDDLEQRSIVIEMQRRRADESVAELREDRCEPLQNLARMCARWADDVADLIRDHDPDMGGLINRVADNWRPLFAIADMIGDDWPERARDAAASLMPKEVESIGPMLLEDIKAAFESKNTDRLSSADMCEALNGMEGKPWGDWKGKTLTPNQLARLLKPFGLLTNTTIRVGTKTAKGYLRHQFEEPWTRYLTQTPSKHTFERSQGNNADGIGTSTPFQKVTGESSVTFQKVTETSAVTFQTCEKTPSNGHCYRVTDQNVVSADTGEGVDVCDQCGKPGDVYPIAFGAVEAMVHPGCRDAWVAAQDDLTIPTYLDRRGEVAA